MCHNSQPVILARLRRSGSGLGCGQGRGRAAQRIRSALWTTLLALTPRGLLPVLALLPALCGLAVLLCALALFWALPSTAALAAPESIQIVRPLDSSKDVYLENDDGLLIVPGGRMFLFQVEISALNPLLEVRINGRTHSTPRSKWTFIKLTQFLHRGKNRIVVEARTDSGKARQEFIIELRGLPGFRVKPDKPAS